MTDLRKAAEQALDFMDWLCGDDNSDRPKYTALNLESFLLLARTELRQALAQPKREWEELDVNEVREIIYENVPDPSPELLDKLYGLIAEADRLLQEKNGG